MGYGDVIRSVNDRAGRGAKDVLPLLAVAEVSRRDFNFANCLLRDECQSSGVFNRASFLISWSREKRDRKMCKPRIFIYLDFAP